MKRRTALKSLALVMGGTIALPAWAKAWNADILSSNSNWLVSPDQQALLAEIVETIIPATNTPGAKDLGVHRFILTMLTDCYEKSAQNRFVEGLKELDETVRASYGKSFVTCTPAQRLEILKAREEVAKILPPEKEPFFPFLKNITIQGYLNSEYVMREVYKYELVPGRYNGCFPVTASAKK
ncbi:gluconate 2-dehydrogenase subunit 3 family protein [Adhaeribacter rhizoryzae]|uniref:Gluconate 2-dehydrogenase subunit 3 family protein n=1 Tax=Adhaeribacter rhizoryzae TaxID=2607907 RepID=A0A5M6DMS7_9BACT|nr:gluconate 2-dehydrogenase subunit 3 family protein [Adhaeribacter rhizoryzae]KAA5548847.1 gluconate 2-dehydrogenase subunit 3 family protein [Adhaeribacter rhizoryzae]